MYQAFLVDDEPWILEGIRASVEWKNFGFNLVGTAQNGIEAEEKILLLRPDFILLDIRMPGKDGLTLIRDVHHALPKTLFALISGYADFSYAKQSIDLGVISYLLKPVDEKELEKTLKKAYDLLSSAAQSTIATAEDSVKYYIDTHYAEKISLSEMMSALSLSSSTIYRKIMQETGESFQQYLTRRRIDAAREMLHAPYGSIGDIAKKCGYDDPMYFTRVFKKIIGCTPSEYRESTIQHNRQKP